MGLLWDFLCRTEGNPSLPLGRSSFRGRAVLTRAGCRSHWRGIHQYIELNTVLLRAQWRNIHQVSQKDGQSFPLSQPQMSWTKKPGIPVSMTLLKFQKLPYLEFPFFSLLSTKVSPKFPSKLTFRLTSSWYHVYQESKPLNFWSCEQGRIKFEENGLHASGPHPEQILYPEIPTFTP